MQGLIIAMLVCSLIAWASMGVLLFAEDWGGVTMFITAFAMVVVVMCAMVAIPEGESKSYIAGTPDNGYTIYYDGRELTEEERKFIKHIDYIERDFNVEVDKENKRISITEPGKKATYNDHS